MHSDLLIHHARAAAAERAPVLVPRDEPGPAGWAAASIIALRLARSDEQDVVEGLAALDGVPPLGGRVMLAVVDGRPVAAGSLADGRVAADPFSETHEAVALLRTRLASLAAVPRPRRWRPLRRVLRPA